MRIQILLSVAGLAAVLPASLFAQTPTDAVPPPTQSVPSRPVPQGSSPADQSAPAYAPQQRPPQSVPAPTPAPPPAIAPAQPTPQVPYVAQPPYLPYGVPDEDKKKDSDGSTYVPLDSWIYPEMMRLYSLGYADTMFLSMRPWTRKSVEHMLQESEDDIRESDSDEAKEILSALQREFQTESTDGVRNRGTIYGTESVYTRLMGISGTTLRDSYHLGQTLVNDYGRPYQPGFNSLIGFSSLAERGRFSFYMRGEYQHAPSAAGYSQALSAQLSSQDVVLPYSGFNLHQATIPSGPIAAANPFRLVEATLSFHVLGHEISGGKQDSWLGPAQGGGLAWSNNAENIYSFRIDRVEPVSIPLLSRLTGPLRYNFFVGSLKGHTDPNHPWVHAEMFAFRPTKNFEFGFERTIIFGGAGHAPVNLHTFLKGFFDIHDTTFAEKNSRNDPGARFSAFNMSYRLPFVRKYATFYVDSISHDDVTPPSAPRRAAYRTGIYLSQIPGARKLDFRVEAVNTDPPVSRSNGGYFNYFEGIQLQGYTNKGFIMGDWIGREAKGGQAWVTYHLSGNEWIQLEYLNKKNPKDFILGTLNPVTNTYGPGGTTQNSFKATVVKRFHHDDIELNGWFQYEKWKAPVYLPGPQSDTSSAVQITFFPKLKTRDIR